MTKANHVRRTVYAVFCGVTILTVVNWPLQPAWLNVPVLYGLIWMTFAEASQRCREKGGSGGE